MATSLFLAKVFGLYLTIVGSALLMNKSHYQKAAEHMLKNSGLLLITGIVTLIVGILLVLSHNIWVNDWRVIITLLAWITLIKGILRLLTPDVVASWGDALKKDRFYYSISTIALVLGLYLSYLGFLV